MKLQNLPLLRILLGLCRILPMLAFAVVGTVTSSAVEAASDRISAGIIHQRVSPAGKAAEIGYFGTFPDSPDGSKIAYVVYDEKPTPASATTGVSGSLHICNADLTGHVKIRDLVKIQWEDGARQIWLDDDTLAYMDFLPDRVPVTYIIRKNGDLLHGPYQAYLGHGDVPGGVVPLWVDKRQYPNGSSLGSNGIYLYKDGVVSQIATIETAFGHLKERLKGSDNPAEWTLFHPQLSTHGTHLSVRLDTQKGIEYLVTCKVDGTDVRLFEASTKPLHQQWYDDSTLFGQERGGKPADGGPAFRTKRWDRDGKFVELLAGVGNHQGLSPDKNYLVSDNRYTLDPVVVTLFRIGSVEPLAVIMSEAEGPVWKMRTHVNPTFSRDGGTIYFNKPVDGMPQVYRVDVSHLTRARR